MSARIKNFIKNNPWTTGLFFVLIGARLWYIFQPMPIWWDAAIYIGMGKYIFSQGYLGYWESLRPILWPCIQGLAWFIGLSPLVFGKIIVFISSCAALILVYILGCRIKDSRTGFLALLFMGTLPVFFYFTNVQITDIPSMTIGLIAILLLSRDKYFLSGLLVGLAFALRFPQALVILALGAAVVVSNINFENLNKSIKEIFVKLCYVALGFLAILLPYLAFNYFYYHDLFLPFRMASAVLVSDSALLLYGKGVLFYPEEFIRQNPFSVFVLLGLGVALWQLRKNHNNITLLSVVFACVIMFGYFLYQPHKELRYSLAFAPYVILLASYGLVFLIDWIPKKISKILILTTLFLVSIFISYQNIPLQRFTPSGSILYYNSYFKDFEYVRIVTTSPQQVITGGVKILKLYEDWAPADVVLREYGTSVDYIALDTSQIFCFDENIACEQRKQIFLKNLAAWGTLDYHAVVSTNQELFIYKNAHH